MSVSEFLKTNVSTLELCAIRENGKILAMVWIDKDEIFTIHPDVATKEVVCDYFGYLSTINKNARIVEVPCHFIDCK